MTESKRIIFVVDTDSYSGNFEREMCAHITGQIGECEVGKEYIPEREDLKEEYPDSDIDAICDWLDNFTLQQSDGGCDRPTTIWPTPGRSNNGRGLHYDVTEEMPFKCPAYESVAIFFSETPPDNVINFLIFRAKSFKKRPRSWAKEESTIVVKGCRLVTETKTIVETSSSLELCS